MQLCNLIVGFLRNVGAYIQNFILSCRRAPKWGWRAAAPHKSKLKPDKQCTYNVLNNELRSYNNCYSGEAISIAYSEWVFVALVIQYTMRMRRITLSSVACPAL